MLKIRLQPTGEKKTLSYRIVLMEEGKKRNGRVFQRLGFVAHKKGQSKVEIDKEKLQYWVDKGAVISAGLRKLLH